MQHLLRFGQLQRGSAGFLVSLLMSLLIVMASGSVAVGQVPRSPMDTLQSPLRQLETNLSQFNSLLDSNSPELARGLIRLDGRKLFTIAAPAVQDNTPEATTPIESRVQTIEDRLTQLVAASFDPDSLRVLVETDSSSRQPVIYLRYDRQGQPQAEELMTVTSLDAQTNSMSAADWAEEVQAIVESALLTAQRERQPQFLRQQGQWAAVILLSMGLLTLGLSLAQRRLQAQRRSLTAQTQVNKAQIAVAPLQDSPETATLLQQQTTNRQQQRTNDIKRRLLQLSQILVWGLGIFAILGLFPQSRWLQPLIITWVQVPLRLLIVALCTYLVIRLSETAIDHLFWVLQNGTSMSPGAQDSPQGGSQRLVLRFTTFSRVTKSISALLLVSIGVVVALALLGLSISPALLTLTGIVGVGISLASQNLIKDMINGFLILLEDQFGVGDVVTIGEVSGLVENLNLRITQLRSSQGHLITIPNSAITVVQNLSKEWSRVDLSVSVAYESDLEQALGVIRQVAQSMSQDRDWQAIILDEPEVLGVEDLDETGATVRLWIKTLPLKQWEVAREYRRRLKQAFDQAGISIGIPHQSLWLSNADSDLTRPASVAERLERRK
ncbi:MAG: mechanosensitive ion channel family protein [Pegethrix bostrychoides GSE-TBD4-15B]|jgi:small conductance mechanosensitive channel|uniref:Mechanosensitive ion channel family protein n=1 Tax=Pegethrix bostrychoides GSE-TBD4-15B TaxID=2839662 RepID=A0A951U3J8_9CYAN|nr:mechanosensitive ion channel family protein [Pegethrix bostrychoides GSE-TBD4-15B]